MLAKTSITSPNKQSLVGVFNPSKKYDRQIGLFPQGWTQKNMKPPPRSVHLGHETSLISRHFHSPTTSTNLSFGPFRTEAWVTSTSAPVFNGTRKAGRYRKKILENPHDSTWYDSKNAKHTHFWITGMLHHSCIINPAPPQIFHCSTSVS